MKNINNDDQMMNNSNLDQKQKQEKKYNYFYKITNKINNNFYYGVHTTNNLNDGYFGSGTAISKAVLKYGKGNFIKENLKFFSTAEEAFNYEAEIVNEDMIKDPNCYNIILGGSGSHSIGKAVVRDKDGNISIIENTDPRYRKELFPVSTGRIHIFKEIDKEFKNKYVLEQELDSYINDGWELGSNNKGKIWIRLENENGNIISRRMINFRELDKYLNLGWKQGGNIISKTNLGQLYIHKKQEDGKLVKTYIMPEELQDYLDNGWEIGCEQKGMKRIHRVNPDGTESIKTVSPEEYNDYLNNGWKPGYCEDHSRFATQKGRKKVYKEDLDGSLRILSVYEEEVNSYLTNGWKLGFKRPNKLGLILMSKRNNKSVDQVYVPSNLVNNYLNNGYRKGKIK